jgi:hypothetical protein
MPWRFRGWLSYVEYLNASHRCEKPFTSDLACLSSLFDSWNSAPLVPAFTKSAAGWPPLSSDAVANGPLSQPSTSGGNLTCRSALPPLGSVRGAGHGTNQEKPCNCGVEQAAEKPLKLSFMTSSSPALLSTSFTSTSLGVTPASAAHPFVEKSTLRHAEGRPAVVDFWFCSGQSVVIWSPVQWVLRRLLTELT